MEISDNPPLDNLVEKMQDIRSLYPALTNDEILKMIELITLSKIEISLRSK